MKGCIVLLLEKLIFLKRLLDSKHLDCDHQRTKEMKENENRRARANETRKEDYQPVHFLAKANDF